MLEYDFMQLLSPYSRIYKEFPLPVVLCDRGFQVYWSNDHAKRLYPLVTSTAGLADILAEHSFEELLHRIEQSGSCTLVEAPPLSGVSVCMYPILHNAKPVGIVLLLLGEAAQPTGGAYLTSRTAGVLDASIRECVEEIFGTMDSASLKADFLEAGWVKPSFNRIGTYGYRIMRIAGNVAVYTQLQSGQADVRMETLDLGDLLWGIREAVIQLGAAMDIPIHFELPTAPCFLSGNRRLLELAIFNLLHNSMYFTRPENEVTVALCREGRRILFTVSDRGVGIPAERLEDVWRPYAGYTSGGRGAGIGLGLTLVRLVATVHAATAAVSSSEEGTSVTLRFPLAKLTSPLSLGQRDDRPAATDRFSALYTHLADAADSPYREHG